MRHRLHASRTGVVGAALLAVAAWGSQPAVAAGLTFSEPHTVFYGKVLGTAADQDFLVDTGALVWTITRTDGKQVTLHASLFAYHEGQFSYRLNVPHAALALGLENEPGGALPLPPAPVVHGHAEVTVDGQRATLLGPASSVFTLEALNRTATFRLDLGLDRAPLDSDGDGLPDWWEDKHGLDKQDGGDAGTDFSGDGLSALEAYRRGLDPHRDARMPALLTDEHIVYPSGSTAIVLDTADIDSAPGQLTYTVKALALAGGLSLRNAQADPADPDRELAVGDTFTHADLLAGRVVYDHDGSETEPGTFRVAVRDEDPEHPADAATIRLLAFRPLASPPPVMPALEARRHAASTLAAAGHVILDASGLPGAAAVANPSAGLDAAGLAAYRADYGDDRPYVFIGGGEAATLTGGHRDDRLIATGPGGTLTGGAGADRFVFEAFERGRVTVADFVPADGDVLDLSHLPAPAGGHVDDYLRIVGIAGGVELQIALSGDGAGFTNLVVALPGLALADAALYDLVAAGALAIGSLRLEPVLSVVASEPRASQSGPTPGRFTVRRAGHVAEPLTVNLSLTGTALNGVDYQQIGSSVTFPVGATTREIALMPYVTGYQGPAKVAHLRLQAGAGYRLGEPADAVVTIDNLVPLIELDVIEPVAVMVDASPAVIRLRRRDVTSGDTVVRLAIGGTAVAGVDYEPLPALVAFTPGQTAKLLHVNPTYSGQGNGGVRTVTVTVSPDADYAVKPDAGTVSVSVDQAGVPVMAPADGQTLVTRRPTFSWPPIAGATWYQLWINRNGATYASPWVQGATEWTPGADLPAGNYRWWVRGWNATVGHMPWSSAASFEVPTRQPGAVAQLAPDGAQPDRDLLFRWDQTDRRATWFQLWVSRPAGGVWHDRWYQTSAADESSVELSAHPGGASTWWVRGWSPDGYGPWSGPMAFSTPLPPPLPLPAKPTLLAPAAGSVLGGAVDFTYEAARATWFRLYIVRGDRVVLDRWTRDESLAAGPFPAGNYAWWIGAWNAETATTVWSDRRDFSAP